MVTTLSNGKGYTDLVLYTLVFETHLANKEWYSVYSLPSPKSYVFLFIFVLFLFFVLFNGYQKSLRHGVYYSFSVNV